MKQPLVSIITVNYDHRDVTAAMLRSLALLDYPNWEVIVVDNASPKNSSESLKKDFPFIKHISSPVNLGFAGGNNVAIPFATGDYAFFVNNDTEVTPGLVSEMVEYMQRHPECGMACPKIKYYHTPDTIQYAGAVGLHPLTSRSYDIGYLEKDDGRFNDSRKTDLPNGAAMMIPMTLIKKIGQMSEMFFLYYEELDWAARFKHAGYTIDYVGSAEIYHKESVSTGNNSAFKTFFIYRNRYLYIRRNYRGFKRIVAGSFFVLISSPVHMLKHAVKKEWGHVKSIGKALCWNFSHAAFKEPVVNSSVLNGRFTVA